MKKLLLTFFLVAVVFSLQVAPFAFAVTGDGEGGLPRDIDDIPGWICGIAGWLFRGLVVIGIVFTLIAAFTYVTSQGSTEAVETANKSLLYIAIGIAIAIIASAVPSVVGGLLGTPVTGCETSSSDDGPSIDI